MHNPAAYQSNCVRYAFTDTKCVQHGCIDCPATLYAKELSEQEHAAMRATGFWTLLGWCAVAWLLIAAAGAYGLSQQEHEYQISRRV